MKKILISVLLLASSAVACPQVKGYMAGGLLKQSSSLTPECGVFYRTYKANFLNNMTIKTKYLELFELHNYDGAGTFATNVISNLKKKGYIIFDTKQQDNSTITIFTNGSDVIMFQAFMVTNQLFIAFAGSKIK